MGDVFVSDCVCEYKRVCEKESEREQESEMRAGGSTARLIEEMVTAVR